MIDAKTFAQTHGKNNPQGESQEAALVKFLKIIQRNALESAIEINNTQRPGTTAHPLDVLDKASREIRALIPKVGE